MNANILHDPTFPHGTPNGYRDGCHGGSCPAPVACRDVHLRYTGDYGFRRRINAGMTAAEIVAAEKVEAETRAAERRAKAMTTKRKPGQKRPTAATAPKRYTLSDEARLRKNERARAARAAGIVPDLTPYRARVKSLHDEGLTDGQIADRLGKKGYQIAAVRRELRLAPNKIDPIDGRVRELHGQGLNDVQIGRELGRHHRYIGHVRRRLELPAHEYVKPSVVPDVLRMHAEGATPDAIAAHVDRNVKYIQRIIRESATAGVSA